MNFFRISIDTASHILPKGSLIIMLRKLKISALLLLSATTLTACGNKTFFDTTYTFHYAQIKFPDGTIKTERIKEWNDYEGEQLQIKFEDGSTYVVHSSQAVLSVGPIENGGE